MTISTILGLRGPPSTTSSPTGGLGHRAPSLHGAQNRGDIWIHSEGWKGGKKGDSAALSALTLLAFLFFLHILQSCLQDMNNAQSTVVLATGGARREEMPAMVAVPMATPMPMAGAPAPSALQAGPGRARSRRHAHSAELARHLHRVQQQQQQQQQRQHSDAGWQMVSVVAASSRRPVRVKVTSPPAGGQSQELQKAERVVSITPRPSVSEATAMVRVSSSSLEAEPSSEEDVSRSEPAANKQEEYDLAASTERVDTTTVSAATAAAVVPVRPVPGTVIAFVPLARPLASSVRSVFSLLAAPLLRLVQPAVQGVVQGAVQQLPDAGAGPGLGAALGSGLSQGLREGLRSAICCDLVVCEAQRLGSLGGTVGERVATTVGSVVRWVCGETDLTARTEREGGEQGGCRYLIDQCERRAGRRTAVTTIASLLEAYVTGGRP